MNGTDVCTQGCHTAACLHTSVPSGAGKSKTKMEEQSTGSRLAEFQKETKFKRYKTDQHRGVRSHQLNESPWDLAVSEHHQWTLPDTAQLPQQVKLSSLGSGTLNGRRQQRNVEAAKEESQCKLQRKKSEQLRE